MNDSLSLGINPQAQSLSRLKPTGNPWYGILPTKKKYHALKPLAHSYSH